MKIVGLDEHCVNPGDLSWNEIEKLGEFEVYERTKPEDVVSRAKDADAILVNKVEITAEVLDKLPKLKYIGEMATGYNNIDIEAAKDKGIVVTNIPAYSTDSVAQLVFAHILNVTNSVAHYADETRHGSWSHQPDFCYWDTPLVELSGKTIGIVGLGHIGMKVAGIAHSLGMDVSAVTSKETHALPSWIRKSTLSGLLSSSFVVTLHCPLTEQTRHMINKDTLKLMHEGAILVNTGRGPLVDEDAVADALASKRLGAYCADVMSDEPPLDDNPLFHCENAFITPHIAWASREARARLIHIAASNIQSFLSGNPINVVNGLGVTTEKKSE